MKISKKTAPGFLLFAILLGGCNFISDYDKRYNGNVTGTVYDRVSGEPLEGVSVYYDYFENPLDHWGGTYYYYGDQVLEGSTTTDGEGRFLIRSLEEQKKHILILRKWPGFDQVYDTITVNPFQTREHDFYLDSAKAEFSIEPALLHYKQGEDRHYLMIINEGEIPIEWKIVTDIQWISSTNWTGILAGREAEVSYIELLRDDVNGTNIQDTIFIKVLSTGETRAVPISVEN